jgi:hypothetical protein
VWDGEGVEVGKIEEDVRYVESICVEYFYCILVYRSSRGIQRASYLSYVKNPSGGTVGEAACYVPCHWDSKVCSGNKQKQCARTKY